jgi:Tfp pilus assembly protein PilX
MKLDFTLQKSKQTRRGFTLLLAVLVSSILIALGSAIFDIAIKEITLSSAGRESQFAFYSADTGIECALYWDLKQNAFATSSAATVIRCGGYDAPVTRTIINQGNPAETYITTFSFPLATAAPCTSVKVTRQHYPVRTVVESSGYNTCITDNPLRLERTIRVTY